MIDGDLREKVYFVRVRSRILEQNSPRQRENYFEKFLKILKVIITFIEIDLNNSPLQIAFTTIK
jgi:hypothetical protein